MVCSIRDPENSLYPAFNREAWWCQPILQQSLYGGSVDETGRENVSHPHACGMGKRKAVSSINWNILEGISWALLVACSVLNAHLLNALYSNTVLQKYYLLFL